MRNGQRNVNPTTRVIIQNGNPDVSLYSVIDTEQSVNRGLVIDYLKKHYTLVSADEASLQYCFTNQNKSMVITTMKISDSYFNVNYSLVY